MASVPPSATPNFSFATLVHFFDPLLGKWVQFLRDVSRQCAALVGPAVAGTLGDSEPFRDELSKLYRNELNILLGWGASKLGCAECRSPFTRWAIVALPAPVLDGEAADLQMIVIAVPSCDMCEEFASKTRAEAQRDHIRGQLLSLGFSGLVNNPGEDIWEPRRAEIVELVCEVVVGAENTRRGN